MKRHEVAQGEDIASIASAYAWSSWRRLYEHPGNAELRAKRPDPFTLRPGDVVNIPDEREWLKRSCATGKLHVFGHKAEPPIAVLLHLRFDWGEGSTRYARKRYALSVDGERLEGLTASDAQLHHAVPLGAKRAELALWLEGEEHEPERWTVDLSHLDPVEAISGIKGRMINLGFLDDPGTPLDDSVDEPTKRALASYELAPKPKLDPPPAGGAGAKPNPRALLEARARPEFRPGPEYLAVGRSHRLRLVPKPRRLYLRLAAGGRSPYAEQPFVLEVDGQRYEGKVSAASEIDLEVPASAREASLSVMIEGLDEPEQWALELGDPEAGELVGWGDAQDSELADPEPLDEATEDARFVASLVNLGFLDASHSEDGGAVAQATTVFQAVHGLTPSGTIDAPTLARMRRVARG